MDRNSEIVTPFIVEQISSRLEAIAAEACNLLQEDHRTRSIATRVESELEHHRARGIVLIAFVGQYNAGKSTIVSALTRRDDIRIHTDIATDEATEYDWNGLKIVDTPGIWTERKEHDQITYDAIRNADLLVYCITSQLPDDLIAMDFRELAFSEGFAPKMLLVINKMVEEAGDWDEREIEYRTSLEKAIEPHSIAQFPVVFVDAREFLDGVHEDDEELVTLSRFSTFVEALNQFVKDRGTLGSLTTPVHIVLEGIEEAESALLSDESKDGTFFLILDQYSRVVRLHRSRLKGKVRDAVHSFKNRLLHLGNELAAALGEEKKEELDARFETAERRVESWLQELQEEVVTLVDESSVDLQHELSEVMEGNLARTMYADIECNAKFEVPAAEMSLTDHREQYSKLKNIGTNLSRKLEGLAAGPAGQGGSGFLRAGQAAGGQLHKAVYGVGKFLSYNFRPWQAVNIAKTLGNVAKIAGPVLSLGAIVLDAHLAHQEKKKGQKLASARSETTGQFVALGRKIEIEFDRFFNNVVERELFQFVETHIAEVRSQAEGDLAANSQLVQKLGALRIKARELLEQTALVE